MKIIEVVPIAPTFPSQKFPPETSLSLTFFDILWLRLPPVERVFFYEFPHPTSIFFDTILPKLKHSLSILLASFFPLVGHLTWPVHSDKPFINYNDADTVLFTVAESHADFNLFVGSDISAASEIRHLVPNLTISHEHASLLSVQVTLFPNSGFSIGITTHHAVLDGKTSTSFIKAWAYLCNMDEESPCSLPPELTPFYDRDMIKDPNELATKFASDWLKQNGPNNRSLNVWDLQVPEGAIRSTFHLSKQSIEKLKQWVLANYKGNEKLHLSTLVLSLAYACVSRVKAEGNISKKLRIVVNVDCRLRLDPPIPSTYFGNCVGARYAVNETTELLGENGLIVLVESISAALDIQKDGVLSGAESWSSNMHDGLYTNEKIIGAAGSPFFKVYGIDFGWGRPKKVEMSSIEKTSAFCISDTRNGDGVEIGFVCNKQGMEAFASNFAEGLEF